MLIDDHEVVRDGIARLINKELEFNVIASIGGVSDVFELLKKEQPNLILLDLKLQDGDGISTAIQLKKLYPKIKIIILSGYIEPYSAEEAKRIGIEGYILKTIASRYLITSIQRVLKGHEVYDDKVEVLAETKAHDPLKKLSNQEFHLIRLLCLGKTSKEIADIMKIAEKTVRNYTSRLYKKINVSSRSEAVAYYMRNK